MSSVPKTPSSWCWRAARWAVTSSGAKGFEAAVLVGGTADGDGVRALRELSPAAPIIVTNRAGTPL